MESSANVLKRLERLSAALVCDILDDYYDAVASNRYLMDGRVKPLFPTEVCGIAKTFSGSSSAGGAEPPSGVEPNATGNAALESVREGEVVVYGTDWCTKAACWGELMSTAASARGGRGLVTDGLARDVPTIVAMKPPFSVFAAGTTPTSGKGRFVMHAYDIPVWCGGVQVTPGDLVLGDLDGVVVIPRKISEDVITKSEDRLKTEGKVRTAFRKRTSVSDVMGRYKVG